jgi:hypothetical protein
VAQGVTPSQLGHVRRAFDDSESRNDGPSDRPAISGRKLDRRLCAVSRHLLRNRYWLYDLHAGACYDTSMAQRAAKVGGALGVFAAAVCGGSALCVRFLAHPDSPTALTRVSVTCSVSSQILRLLDDRAEKRDRTLLNLDNDSR